MGFFPPKKAFYLFKNALSCGVGFSTKNLPRKFPHRKFQQTAIAGQRHFNGSVRPQPETGVWHFVNRKAVLTNNPQITPRLRTAVASDRGTRFIRFTRSPVFSPPAQGSPACPACTAQARQPGKAFSFVRVPTFSEEKQLLLFPAVADGARRTFEVQSKACRFSIFSHLTTRPEGQATSTLP